LDATLSVAELQKWARHASPETTMSYYHHRSAIELAKRVGWTDELPAMSKFHNRQMKLWDDV
jgi:integrase